MSVDFFFTILSGSIVSVFLAHQFLGDRDCFRLIECFAKLCCHKCIKNSSVSPRPSNIAIPPPMYISSTRQRIILITDIGRDTDTPLALIALANHTLIELAGVITTGGNTINRGRVVRYWLRICGIKDDDCFVVPDYSNVSGFDESTRKRHNNCQVPLSADAAHNSSLYRRSRDDAIGLLLSEANTWKSHLHVVCLANTTTLADAFECNPTVMNQVGKIIIPGSVQDFRGNNELPVLDYQLSPTLAEDCGSADFVLEMCATASTAIHFIEEIIDTEYRLNKLDIKHVCNYMRTVRDTYKYIMDIDYERFCIEHDVDRTAQPSTWFNRIQHVCIPSKTLLVLAYIEPHWFESYVTEHGVFTVTKTGKYRKKVKDRLLKCIEVFEANM